MPVANWWTEEDIAKLREMRANGDSLRFIARELGRHRGTIANKCKRLGLPLSTEIGRRLAMDNAAPKKVKKARGLPPEPPAPSKPMLHLSLVELDDWQCHFPIGNGPFTFCGHGAGKGPYCSHHEEIAYGRAG